MVRSSFTPVQPFDSRGNEGADVDVGVGRDCGDLHDFGGGGNFFGVGREEFEDTVDGSLGTLLKIHGLQPEVIFVTPSHQ